MEKHVLLKKLRELLESLKGRVAGRNKEEVEDAIAMVSFCNCVLHYSFVVVVHNKHKNTCVSLLPKFLYWSSPMVRLHFRVFLDLFFQLA